MGIFLLHGRGDFFLLLESFKILNNKMTKWRIMVVSLIIFLRDSNGRNVFKTVNYFFGPIKRIINEGDGKLVFNQLEMNMVMSIVQH